MGTKVKTASRPQSTRRAMEALRRIVRALRLFDRSAEKLAGLSGARVFVLQILADSGPVSMAELSRQTHTDPSSVSVVAAKLAERRLVSIRRSSADGRSRELSITAAGRAVLRRVPESAQARLIAALHKMPLKERGQLARQLEALAQCMGAGETAMFFEESNEPNGDNTR